MPALREEIKTLDKQIEEINSLEAQKQQFIARMQIIEKLQRSRPEIVHVFDTLRDDHSRRHLSDRRSRRPTSSFKIAGRGAVFDPRVLVHAQAIDDFAVAERTRTRGRREQDNALAANSRCIAKQRVSAADESMRSKPANATDKRGHAMTFEELQDNSIRQRSRSLAAAGPARRHRAFFVVLCAAADLLRLVWNQQERRARPAREAGSRRCARSSATKHGKAVNLELYKQQLADIEKLLRRHAAAAAGQDRNAEPAGRHLADRPRSRPAAGAVPAACRRRTRISTRELPIKIRLTGSYHQMGEFVSGIAALPRIVTLHNVDHQGGEQGCLRPAAAGRDGQDLSLSR